MAHETTGTGTPPTDHHETYDRFISMSKWGVAFVSVVLILMAVFIA